MTDDVVARLRRLRAAGAEGEWASGGDCVYAGERETYSDVCDMRGGEATFDPNSDLIAAAVNNLPALLDVVEAARDIAAAGKDVFWPEGQSPLRWAERLDTLDSALDRLNTTEARDHA